MNGLGEKGGEKFQKAAVGSSNVDAQPQPSPPSNSRHWISRLGYINLGWNRLYAKGTTAVCEALIEGQKEASNNAVLKTLILDGNFIRTEAPALKVFGEMVRESLAISASEKYK